MNHSSPLPGPRSSGSPAHRERTQGARLNSRREIDEWVGAERRRFVTALVEAWGLDRELVLPESEAA